MTDFSDTGSSKRTILALRIAQDHEVRMRDLLDQAVQPDRSTTTKLKRLPPPIDFGRLHIAKNSEHSTYLSQEIDALVAHCSAATRLLDGAGPTEEQKLFDELGIIYSFYEKGHLHVIGLVCVRADGTPERHTVLGNELPNNFLFFVPPRVQALASIYENASLKREESDDDDDDDDDELYFDDEDDDDDDDDFARASVQGLTNAPQLKRPVGRELHEKKIDVPASKHVRRQDPRPVAKSSLAPRKIVAARSAIEKAPKRIVKKAPKRIVKKAVDRLTNVPKLRLVEPDPDPNV